MTIQEKMDIALDGWIITKVGIIERTKYLIIAQWDNDDEKNPFVDKDDGKKWSHPTRMYRIDLRDNTVRWITSLEGYSHGYCDGGRTDTNLEAFFSSSNGITYHIDYRKDTFEHEELMMHPDRVAAKTSRGNRGIRLIGNHFYTAYAGNQIHRRDGVKKWTLVSKEPREYKQKLGNGDVEALAAYNEKEIYFCGEEANLWSYDGKHWDKIFDMPKKINFEFIECCDDGKVYAIDSHARGVAVGRGKAFKFIPMKEDDPANGGVLFDSCTFKGKVYVARYSMYEFKDDHWIKANIPDIHGGVEHLAAKDGVMFIGTTHSLYIYNGKETFNLYGGAKDDAKLILNEFLQAADAYIKSGNELLGELDKEKK